MYLADVLEGIQNELFKKRNRKYYFEIYTQPDIQNEIMVRSGMFRNCLSGSTKKMN